MENNNKKFDIDIDFQSNFDPFKYMPQAIGGSMVRNGMLVKHNSAVYLQAMPKDHITGLAAIPYKDADDVGYFKLDFLHLNLLNDFNSKSEIRKLINTEPNWKLLENSDVVGQLSQIHRHFDIVHRVKPVSVDDLADVLALIRPAKRRLLDKYINDKSNIRTLLYKRPDDPKKYYFKRSHAIAYAMNIVLQLHMIGYSTTNI